MEGYVRFDYMFSYWVVIWFVLYYNIDAFKGPTASFVKKIGNPLLALWLAFWFNVYEITYVSLIKLDTGLVLEFCFMIFLIKAVPIYLLYSKGLSINWLNDTIVICIVIAAYVLYLYANNKDPTTIYQETEKSLVQGDNKTPMFYLINEIGRLIR